MSRVVNSSKYGKIQCIGGYHPNGTYCLRISLPNPVNLAFGRFKKGKEITLNAGEYLYVGSALATRGSTTLGNRLRRHTSRSQEYSSHTIQKELLQFFDAIGIYYSKTPASKKLFWNIDHLLNLSVTEIIGIILIRDPKPLENIWSEYLEHLPETIVFEKGLGANDSAGHTHIQYSNLSVSQWNNLVLNLPT